MHIWTFSYLTMQKIVFVSELYIHTYIHSANIHLCVCVSERACMRACVCVCVYVYVHIYVYCATRCGIYQAAPL